MDESFELVLSDWRTRREQLQAIRRKVFILEQKIPEADEFDDADENSSHVLVLSEKRDAVGTGRIEATGKIARIAVVAEYRDQGVGTAILERLIKEVMRKHLWKPAYRMCLQAWIYKSVKHGTNSGKRSAVGHFKQR